MSEKIATTLNIDKDIKTSFKMECIRNEVEMSETVEQMMLDYTKVSKEMHNILESSKKE